MTPMLAQATRFDLPCFPTMSGALSPGDFDPARNPLPIVLDE
jgi:hypothetical protein